MFLKILNGFLRSATSDSMDVVAFDYLKEEKKEEDSNNKGNEMFLYFSLSRKQH